MGHEWQFVWFHCLTDRSLMFVAVCFEHWLFATFQADAGAQAVQIFDSWASNLAPQDYDVFAGPYINQIVDSVKQTHPNLPLILYISGSGGLLERMAKCNVEVISIDGSVDMQDAIRRIGPNFAVQVRLNSSRYCICPKRFAVFVYKLERLSPQFALQTLEACDHVAFCMV